MTDGQAFNTAATPLPKASVNGIVRTRGQKNQDRRDARLSSFGIMNGRDQYDEDLSKLMNDE